MKVLSVMALVSGLALAMDAVETTEEPTCPSEPPALPTFVVIDPAPAKYAGPACMKGEGEECVTPEGWFEEPGYKLTDKGAEITYTDVGQLYTYECPAGSTEPYWLAEDQWVKKSFKDGCWKREPVQISSCNVVKEPTPSLPKGVIIK